MSRVLFLLFLSLPLFAQDVTIELAPIEHPPTASVLVVKGTVTNHLDVDLHDVTVFGELAPGPVLAGQSDDVWSCRDNGTLQTVRCRAAVLPARATVPLTFYIDALIGRFHVKAHARWVHDSRERSTPVATTRGWFPRDVRVTHDGDAGAGSLREAIRLANEECEGLYVPCRIVFDAPMTIRPRAPLPVIWGRDVAIDGRGQVTLDGSKVSGGSGLELDGTFLQAQLLGLTIRNFPWDGVNARQPNVVVAGCTIERNGSRGVTSEANAWVHVIGNRIRHNGRSGVFALGPNTSIRDNDVEENGASGVFIARYNAEVVGNRIRGNGEFGIAVDRSVGTLTISENSIEGNRIAGIDRGLDGHDGDRYDDYATHAAYIPPPRVTSATYDPSANATTIRGTYFDARDRWGAWSLELFTNAAPEGQGATFLGRTSAANGAFALVVQGDLRGQFITATGFRQLWLGWSGDWWWTSEFSQPIEVR